MSQTPDDRFTAASTFPEAAPKTFSGGMIVDTPEGIERFRMITLLSALKLESKGIKVRRGFSALKMAQSEYGIKARTAVKAHAELEAKMVEQGIITR